MTVKLSRKDHDTAGWTFGIVLPDGSERIATVDDLTDAVIEAFARSEVARRDTAAAATGKTHYNVGDLIDLTPPADTPPTQAQTAQQQFSADLRTYQQLQRAASFGLIAPDDPRIAQAQGALKAEWLDAYLRVL